MLDFLVLLLIQPVIRLVPLLGHELQSQWSPISITDTHTRKLNVLNN